MNWLILLLAGMDPQRRPEVLKQALVAGLPVSSTDRMAFVTFRADQQAKQQALQDELVLTDAVRAAKFKLPEHLEAFPALNAAFKRLSPTAQAAVFSGAEPSCAETPAPNPKPSIPARDKP